MNRPNPPLHTRRSVRALFVMLASLSLYTAADLVSKEWALDNLSRVRLEAPPPLCQPHISGYVVMQRVPTRSKVLVDDYLEFRYAENCGAAFGMLRGAPAWTRILVFGASALAACIALPIAFMRGFGGKLFALGIPLVLSGAIGNTVDRIRHGYVVDFIRFHIGNRWEYPTFNVADVAIAVGVALWILDMWVSRTSAAQSVPDATPHAPSKDGALL